uniref:Ionotropic glutamate receptor C-terminal domain-containing protein n=2 Tax=Photinus pyralis TaxID=7054 RepID=A0A1Y1KNL0_PHOPY
MFVKVFILIAVLCIKISSNEGGVSIDSTLVGGLFEGFDQEGLLVFNVAVDMANKKQSHYGRHLKATLAYIEPEYVIDTVHKSIVGINWSMPMAAMEMMCSMLRRGVVAVFTSLSESSEDIVQSICDSKEIPVIKITASSESDPECCSISMYPHRSTVVRAFSDLVQYFKWKNFALLYEMSHVDSFLEVLKVSTDTGATVDIHLLHQNETSGYRNVWKDVRKSKATKFIVICSIENLSDVLQQAQEVGLMTIKYNYIILNFDLHTIDLSLYQYSEANIFGVQLIDPTAPLVIEAAQEIQLAKKKRKMLTHPPHITAWKLRASSALLIDAVNLFSETLKDMHSFTVLQLSCNATDNWAYGSTIYNFLKMRTMTGLTGLIKFDHKGFRSEFNLNIIQLKEGGIAKIGTWSPKDGIKMDNSSMFKDNLKEKHLNVMISWSEPYTFYKNSSTVLLGNDQFEGFVVDIISEISKLEGFNYTLIRNEDDKNGDYDPVTQSWNGMIGDILSGKGDIAIGDMAITKEREEYVDFTVPFMSLGIQILYVRPSKPVPVFFSFAHPFHPEVWLWIGISYFTVSVGLYVMARVCQPEWDNWDRCIKQPKYFVNQFHLRNSFWFVLGCFMQQGAEIAPRATSTRILSSFFAFFILVIVSFYKAQLAASLTTEKLELPFSNAEELVKRADKLGITYGAVTNEATHKFFQRSKDPVFSQIGDYMNSHPEHMAEDAFEGSVKVLEGNHAFFMESVTIQYAANVVCEFISVGERLDERYFGIALRKDSGYRNRLSSAILLLQQKGVIDQLQRKWWEEALGSKLCKEPPPDTVAPPLTLHHMAGIFWITIVGVIFSFVVSFFELGVDVYHRIGVDKKIFFREYKKEIKNAFNLSKTIKTVAPNSVSLENLDVNE